MRKNPWLTPILFVLIALLLISPVLYIKSKNKSHPIAIIDLQLLVEEKQQQIVSSGEAPTEQQHLNMEKITVAFAKKLSTTIETLGQECQCVILNKAAVLGGNPIDYTDIVRERMQS